VTVVVALIGALAAATLLQAARRADSGARLRPLTARTPRTLPPRLRIALQRALRDADVRLEPESAVEWWLAGALAIAVLASAFAPGLLVPALLGALLAGPVALRLGRTRRERRFAVALPGALEQVAAELRSGGTVGAAVDRLAATDGPIADDLRRVKVRTGLGLGLGAALEVWPAEHDAPGVRAAAGALAVAADLGGRSAEAIDGLATSLRHRLDALAEAQALSAQARLSAVVVGAAPVGYLCFAGLVDPESVGALVTTGVGRVCLVVGLGLECLAALWIRRIVRSEA
jgi:tight adherence protein B